MAWGTWHLFCVLAAPDAPRGVAYLAAGGITFAVAISISTLKGGGMSRLRDAPRALVESSRRRYRERYLA